MEQLRNQRGQKVKDGIDFFMVSERERKGKGVENIQGKERPNRI